MYLILTTKPGIFRTEPGDGLRPVEAYDYLTFGKHRARFVIAEQVGDQAVAIVDEAPPPVINRVPKKLFAKYQTIEQARAELQHLVQFGSSQVSLERVS
jgi:hypothetical protein